MGSRRQQLRNLPWQDSRKNNHETGVNRSPRGESEQLGPRIIHPFAPAMSRRRMIQRAAPPSTAMYAVRTKKACNWPGNSLTLTKPPVWVETPASAIHELLCTSVRAIQPAILGPPPAQTRLLDIEWGLDDETQLRPPCASIYAGAPGPSRCSGRQFFRSLLGCLALRPVRFAIPWLGLATVVVGTFPAFSSSATLVSEERIGVGIGWLITAMYGLVGLGIVIGYVQFRRAPLVSLGAIAVGVVYIASFYAFLPPFMAGSAGMLFFSAPGLLLVAYGAFLWHRR